MTVVDNHEIKVSPLVCQPGGPPELNFWHMELCWLLCGDPLSLPLYTRGDAAATAVSSSYSSSSDGTPTASLAPTDGRATSQHMFVKAAT